MSTKRIREALQALATFTGAEGDPMTILSEPAMKEVEAIADRLDALVETLDAIATGAVHGR